MATPGLMFVVSHVRDPQKTSDALYNRFYNEEHLPAVLSGGHVKLGLRYKSTKYNSAMPYVALYPVDDASTIGSPESLKRMEETRKSRILECDDIFDLIHFELRPYEKIDTYENPRHEGQSDLSRGRTMTYLALEPAEGQDEAVEAWYQEEHLPMLCEGVGFRRCTRYKRKDGVCPRFLTLAEYDCTLLNLPRGEIEAAFITPWSTIVLNEAKVCNREFFVLVEAQGDTNLNL